MTEVEWLKRNLDAQSMVMELNRFRVARRKAGRRKLRLFGCECCRRFWEHLSDDKLLRAVEIAESFAEGRATKENLAEAHSAVEPLTSDNYHASRGHDSRERTAASMIYWLTVPPAFDAALAMTCYELPLAGYCGQTREANRLVCDFLRDIFGNPFHPVVFASEWRTSTALALAAGMYESRDFSAMPILADALQDAGCDNADVLDHCRDEKATHVRGCWVVDLVLGKE